MTVEAGLPSVETTDAEVADVTMFEVDGDGELEDLLVGEEEPPPDDGEDPLLAEEESDGWLEGEADADAEDGAEEAADVEAGGLEDSDPENKFPPVILPMPASARLKRDAPFSQQLKEMRSASQQ